MVALFMRLAVICCTFLLLPMGGCAVNELDSEDPAPPEYEQAPTWSTYEQTRFKGLDSPWVGRESEELIAELGAPDAIYKTKPTGNHLDAGNHALSYIYEIDSESDDSCISVYVVAETTGEIIKYFCR